MAQADQEEIHQVRELARELEKYRQIVESASDAVVTINQAHEVIFMNRAAEEMFGYSRKEILGGDLGPLLCPEHAKAHRHYVERYLKTRKPRVMGHSADLLGQRRDGSRFPVAISFSMAEVAGMAMFTAILRDLSEQKSLEEEVKNAQSLAAVGEMVAMVSHEIRTPLSLIGGFARQLQRGEDLSAKGRDKLDIIVQEVARLEQMLNELGDLSRPSGYHWERVDLSEVLDHVLELLGARLAKMNITVQRKVAPDLPWLVADRHRLSQVMINLISNAAQACEEGCEVQVELSAQEEGGVLLKVTDQGKGIPEEHRSQIFTPFFTTKKQGTGLGLPIVKRIVEEHGGSVGLESSPGKGTTVKVNLPPPPGET